MALESGKWMNVRRRRLHIFNCCCTGTNGSRNGLFSTLPLAPLAPLNSLFSPIHIYATAINRFMYYNLNANALANVRNLLHMVTERERDRESISLCNWKGAGQSSTASNWTDVHICTILIASSSSFSASSNGSRSTFKRNITYGEWKLHVKSTSRVIESILGKSARNGIANDWGF